MKLTFLLIIGCTIFAAALGVNIRDEKDPRNIGISITGTLDSNDRRPGVIGGGVVGPSRGYPSNNQGRYPNQEQGRYPNQEQGRYPNQEQGRFPDREHGTGRYPDRDQDRFPDREQGRYPDRDQGRYPVQGDRDRYPAEFDYVTFYEQPYFRGWSFKAPLSSKCRNLENDYNNYNNGISSIKTHGNCVVVYTRFDCRGREFTVRPRYEERRPGQGHGQGSNSNYRPNYLGHSELAEDLNNNISSYRRC